MGIINEIVQKLMEESNDTIIKFGLHTFKGCNTGVNSYTHNWRLGQIFIGKMSVDDVIKEFKVNAMPELLSLTPDEETLFNKIYGIEIDSITKAFYDTISC